jgi:hypothetical protein
MVRLLKQEAERLLLAAAKEPAAGGDCLTTV